MGSWFPPCAGKSKRVEMSGLFVSRPDGYYIILNGERHGDPLEVIYHEYTHHYLENNLHNVPAWFNEGLAECYGTFRADDNKASIGLTQEDHLLYLQQHDLLPLHDLFAITYSSPDYNEGDRRGAFYAESWALVHYLTWDKPERKPQYLRFLDRLSRGDDPDTAFPASFGAPFKTLEFELRNYVRQGRFLYTVFPFTELAVDDAVKVASMKREEVLFRLGDLLAHLDSDRAAEAGGLLREAQRLAPDYAAPPAGLAYLACQAERYDEAIDLYDRAIALDPDDPVTRFHFGQCLARRPPALSPGGTEGAGPPDFIRAAEMFGKAIQIRPGFAEAYVEYARILLEQGGEPGPAIHLLETAQKMLPARIDVIEDLATLYAMKGDVARANSIIENVLTRMNDREAVEQTRSRVRVMEDRRGARQPSVEPQTAGAESARGTADGPADDEPPALPESPVPGSDPGVETVAARERHVAALNQAVARANLSDLKGAIAILEGLQHEVKAADLRDQITLLLDKMRKDLARLQKSRR